MAKLKPTTSGNSSEAPDVRLALDVVLSAVPAAAADLMPAERAVWRAVASDVALASIGTEFDPRAALTLEGPALARWHVRRAEWVRVLLATDPRVER